MSENPAGHDGEFFPKGAVFFFICMLGFFAAIWGGIYLMMVGRA